MDEQTSRPSEQPPGTASSSPPGDGGAPPGAYPGSPLPGQGYVPGPAVPGGYPPIPSQYPYMAPPPMPQSTGIPWWGWLLGGCLGILVIGGIACAVLGSVLGARLGSVISRISNQQFVTTTTTQTFTVSDTPTFVVDNPAGTITYKASSGTTVTIQITRRAGDSSAAAAERDLQGITAAATQSGDTIIIRPDLGDGAQSLGQTLNVDVVITGPPTATLDITDQTGNVALTGVQGVVSTDMQVGSIRLQNVTLATGSYLHTNVGSITMNGQLAPGAAVNLMTNIGSVDVTLPASTSIHLNAKTNTGNVSITGWPEQQTSGAVKVVNEDLGSNPSGSLTINVETGSITLTAAG